MFPIALINMQMCSGNHRSQLSAIWSAEDAAVYGGDVGFNSCCLRGCEERRWMMEREGVGKINR